MIKFIVPALIIFLIILFWDKISNAILKKFKIKINYIVFLILILFSGIVSALLYF